ncbi:MAG: tetratricopeptide repeat protein [Bacteroidota bacterium]
MKKNSLSNNNSNDTLIKIIIVVFSFILYFQTVKFDFVLDDESFYEQNTLVQGGIKNIGTIFTSPSIGEQSQFTSNQPYRPLTITIFALEHSIFNNNTAALHFFNLLIYSLTLLVLYATLKKLFSNYSYHLIALIVLLYAAHPIHSEVVANIKTLDEMLAALFGCCTWYYFLNIATNNSSNLKNTLQFSAFSLLTILSKESGIVFFAILPLSLLIIKKTELKKVVLYSLPFIVTTLLFFALRQHAIASQTANPPLPILDNVLYIANTLSEKIATRFLTLYLNFKTLIIPYPLAWDYSYSYVYVANFSDYHVIASILIYTSLFISSIYYWKRNPIISFSILFYFICILPTSNIFFINSTNFAERFLFTASLSLPIIVVELYTRIFKVDISYFTFKWSNKSNYWLIGLLLIFSGMTLNATAYWKNNLTLFERGVVVCGNNTRAHYNLGQEYWKLAQKNTLGQANNDYAYKAIDEFKKSLAIYPGNFMAMTNLACVYDLTNNLDSSIYLFTQSQKIYANQPVINKNIGAIYAKKASAFESASNSDSAEANYKVALTYDVTNITAWNNLGLIYYNRNNASEAIKQLEKGLTANPENITLLESCAVMSFLTNNYQQAIAYGLRGLKADGQSKKIIGVLADANHALGNDAEVQKYQRMMSALGN